MSHNQENYGDFEHYGLFPQEGHVAVLVCTECNKALATFKLLDQIVDEGGQTLADIVRAASQHEVEMESA